MVFVTLQLCLIIDAASQFVMAEGHESAYYRLQKVSGAFAFTSSILGYYSVIHYLCEDVIGFNVPMGDTSKYFSKSARRARKATEHEV
jgi:hypothetical protein